MCRRRPTLPIPHRIAGDRIARAWRVAIDKDGVILYASHGIYRGDAISMEIELR
jgi:hypothetical protein